MNDDFWTKLLAVWGVLFTINSALSAVLQTKWMYSQKKSLEKILKTLEQIRGDDLRKRKGGD